MTVDPSEFRILIACEESQIVCSEFRKLGYHAFSCDLKETSGARKDWHIKGDVLEIINQEWDLVLAFPPCTHLAVSGARHFEGKRLDGRQKEGIVFFMEILSCNAKRLCVENPVNIIGIPYITKHFPELLEKYDFPAKSTQIINPYQFGHEARKKTCLWLRNLPPLEPTKIVEPKLITYNGGATFSLDYGGKNATERSKTYQGIAEAFAVQWSKTLVLK